MLRGKSPCLWAESVSGRPLGTSLLAGGDAFVVELQQLGGAVRSSTAMPWTFADGRQLNGAHSPDAFSQGWNNQSYARGSVYSAELDPLRCTGTPLRVFVG